jgi:hypothetical protein
MRTLLRWVSRLYPATWRNRYGTEFNALLDDIAPSLGDLCDVLGNAVQVRATVLIHACRVPVVLSLAAHVMLLSFFVLASWTYLLPMPLHVAAAPLPPPAPDPPIRVADPRVFPHSPTLYSSLPVRSPVPGNALFAPVVEGVGINFPSLPDAGATDRRNPERRVLPGQALEAAIYRRVLPEYPRGTKAHGAVSVFLEYLVTRNGSVKVLRTSGPAPFTNAAQSAVERWAYRPVRFGDRLIEAVSRVEVRFDSELLVRGCGAESYSCSGME